MKKILLSLSMAFILPTIAAEQYKTVVLQFDHTTRTTPKYIIDNNSGGGNPPPVLDPDNLTETVIISQDNPYEYDRFGSHIEYDNGYLYIGAQNEDGATNGTQNYGAIYTFQHDGTDWKEIEKTLSPKTTGNYKMGAMFKVYGDKMFAPISDTSPNWSEVIVFERNGAGWTPLQYITDPNPDSRFRTFGFELDYDGTTLMISDKMHRDKRGGVYMYTHNGSNWVLEQTISPSYLGTENYFGQSVAFLNGKALIGVYNAQGQSGNKGWVSVYEKQGGTWVHVQDVTSSIGSNNEYLGILGMFTHGNELFISSEDGLFIFEMQGNQLVETQHIVNDDDGNRISTYFGWQMSIDGDTLVAVETGNQTKFSNMYIFNKEGGIWKFKKKVNESNPVNGNYWGGTVDVKNDRIFTNADSDSHYSGVTEGGAVFVYETK